MSYRLVYVRYETCGRELSSGIAKKTITGCEIWVCGNDVETKLQSSPFKRKQEPRRKSFLQLQWRGVFWVLARRTYDQYLKLMWHSQEVLGRKHPNLWQNNSLVVHLLIVQKHSSDTTFIEHVLCDFFLCPKSKKSIKVCRFAIGWGERKTVSLDKLKFMTKLFEL